ncbi:hypothetical protein [Parasphingorhabdus sp.]|uniref:hypothetical protein n=1 Tax=Parasphingorhabdus sp. TaxID=2709688 RepID=UPI003BAF8DCE
MTCDKNFAQNNNERSACADGSSAEEGFGVECQKETGHPGEMTSGKPDERCDQVDAGHRSPKPRFDGWTPEVRVKFLEALANCGNVRSAVRYVQRSRTSAYNLKQRDVDFSRGWDAAVLISRDDSTDVLQDRAINGIEEDVYYKGEVVGSRRRYDSRLLLAHIARLDKLAERITVSRGAARFGEMLDAIAAQEDTTRLITEPTTEEIAGIVAETEAQATVSQVEAACLRQNNETAAAELIAADMREKDAAQEALWAAADAKYGPIHEVDFGDGQPIDFCRMTPAEATQLMADHPQVKARAISRDDPGYVAAIVTPNEATAVFTENALAEGLMSGA